MAAALNPFRLDGTVLPPNVLLMARITALACLLKGMVSWLPDIFLPFWLPLDGLRTAVHPEHFRNGLRAVFLVGFLILFFTRRPRAGCLLLAGVIFLAASASRTFYGNNRIFAGCLFLLAGLWEPGRGSWALRTQVALMYFGAGLNKLMSADWLSGHFFHYKIVSFFPFLPGAAEGRWVWAARLLCWGTIALEFGLFAGFLVRRMNRAAIWAGLAFHVSALVLFGTDFGLFTVAVGASYLIFVDWPERIPEVRGGWRVILDGALYRPESYFALAALLCVLGPLPRAALASALSALYFFRYTIGRRGEAPAV